MSIPTQSQLIKEAQEIKDSDLSLSQKIEFLRRYYESLENPDDAYTWNEVEEICLNNLSKLKNAKQKSSPYIPCFN